MKKLIVSNKGSKFMGIEEVLEEFRGFACKTYLILSKGFVVNEDEKQELDIIIFKAFQTYDEKHCFTTHLVWHIRKYVKQRLSFITTQKRDMSKYQMLNFDYSIDNGDDSNTSLHDLISDDSINVESTCIDIELINFIRSNLKPLELRLLEVNLDKISLKQMAEELNTSRQNVNNMNSRFKKKLLKLMKKFNGSEFTFQIESI